MRQSQTIVQLIAQFFLPVLLVIGIDAIFNITFGGYFLLCAIALLASYKGARYAGWGIMVTASIVVTLNYLKPANNEYFNTTHHTIALKGLTSGQEMVLVNSDKPEGALFDEKSYDGKIVVKANREGCIMDYSVMSQPIFVYDTIRVDDKVKKVYRLANRELLPHFTNSILFARPKKDSLLINIETIENSLRIRMTSFCRGEQQTDISSFAKIVKKGYPLSAIVGQGINRDSLTSIRAFADLLDGVSIVRDSVGSNSDKAPLWYVSIPHQLLKSFTIYTDSQDKFVHQERSLSMPLSESQKLHIGYGTDETKAICFASKNESVVMEYDMPFMYNFPNDTIAGMNRILAISSSADVLLKSDVKEAFFYNLFHSRNNAFHFNGQINYQSSSASLPLNLTFVDGSNNGEGNEASYTSSKKFQLTSKNGAKWNFEIVNLKKDSPITGSRNLWVNEWFILGIILATAILAVWLYLLFSQFSSSRAEGIFYVWLFFLPLLTLRLYLLWRIAVFPPLINISKNEFLRYRMENMWRENAMLWTIGSIALLLILSLVSCASSRWMAKKKKTFDVSISKIRFLYWAVLIIGLFVSMFNKIAHQDQGWVFANVALPVVVFFVNEYLCVHKLSLGYRIINAIAVLAMLLLGDPGYAIMFILFECLYFIVLSVVYRWSIPGIPVAKLQTATITGLIILFVLGAPWIVVQLYDGSNIIGPVKWAHLNSFVVGGVLSVVIWYIVRSSLVHGTKKAFSVKIAVLLLPFVIAVAAPWTLNENLHFKYRSLIHTQNAGQIMSKLSDDDLKKDNSRRLLEASQNQWFLQYHNNLGEDRILDNGLMHLYPHFKKGVSWSTQISDVICSRYIVGELSLVVPLAFILLCLIFLLAVVLCDTGSSSGKVMSFGIALLILVQTTFVWMANTNRTIFIGQDFPYMSQNARVTMVLFVFLLFIAVMFLGSAPDREDLAGGGLQTGFAHLKGKPISMFLSLFCIVFAAVFLSGNNWGKLYGSDKAGEYGVGDAMEQAEMDFLKINKLLKGYKATISLTRPNCTKLFADIEEKIHLSDAVQTLANNHEISDFSFSLYKAFTQKLVSNNNSGNIVHLRHISNQDEYRFALNKGFYNLRAPEMKKSAWRGNLYAYESPSDASAERIEYEGKDMVVIYKIPKTWLSKNEQECGIVDLWRTNESGADSILLCDDQEKTKVSSYTFLLRQKESLLCFVNGGMYLHRLEGRLEDLLAKGLMLNGSMQHFYPLANNFFWAKHFTDYEVSQERTDTEQDCYLTIDKDLTKQISSLKVSCSYSVIALDGNGYVRLMHDNNRHPDPNNAEAMEEIIESSYLNPDYEKDSKLFGNMNLVHMRPGPGSSLKPITYAAVTSQTKEIDWSSLKLKAPKDIWRDPKENTTSHQITKFGPSYTYQPGTFTSPLGDEYGVEGWIDNDFYLYKSSNYYNALVTYLGSFSSEDISSVMTPIGENGDCYPIFQLNGNMYQFSKSPNPKRDGYMLSTGLDKNFNLVYSKLDNEAHDYSIISKEWQGKQSRRILYPWLFPETSSADILKFEWKYDEPLRLKQYALGADPLSITPLQMAEMYGKLFSLHPDYHALITQSDFIPSAKWNGAWEQSDMLSFYKNNLFVGLRNCVLKGTAKSVFYNSNRELKLTPKYYYYAKTGTLKLDKGHRNDRMLAVIITDRDVCSEEIKNTSENKFYVVYFRYKESGGMPSETTQILNMIINSKSFKDYMGKRNNG